MIIWLLALVLFGCLGLSGWSFGVVRAATTFIGLLVGILLAKMFGHSLEGQMAHIGIKNPAVAWALAPFIVFVVTLIVFKVVGFVLGHKVNTYFKYKAGDLRLGLWNRLNPRLGICVGLFNASVYLVLIVMVIYPVAYATTELSTPENANWIVKMANSSGKQLQSSGMNRVAGALDPMPADYYQAVDLGGLLYHNPLLEARLSRYPAFLSLGQRSEFQALGEKDFTELLQKQESFSTIWNTPQVQAIAGNQPLLKEVWDLVLPNIDDLRKFFETDVSQKYDEKILGYWEFNVNAAITEARRGKTNMTSRQMQAAKGAINLLYTKTTMIASLDNKVFVKNLGTIRMTPVTPGAGAPPPQPIPTPAPGRGGRGRGGGGAPPPNRGMGPGATPAPQMTVTVDMQNPTGNWRSSAGSGYRLDFGSQRYQGRIDGDRLILTSTAPGAYTLVFDRSY